MDRAWGLQTRVSGGPALTAVALAVMNEFPMVACTGKTGNCGYMLPGATTSSKGCRGSFQPLCDGRQNNKLTLVTSVC